MGVIFIELWGSLNQSLINTSIRRLAIKIIGDDPSRQKGTIGRMLTAIFHVSKYYHHIGPCEKSTLTPFPGLPLCPICLLLLKKIPFEHTKLFYTNFHA